MAFRPGHRAYVGLDNAAGTLQNLSTYFDDVSVSYSIDQLDVTTFGTAGVKRFIPGLAGGDTFTLSGPMDTTALAHVGSCIAAQQAGTASFSFEYGPGGSVSGQPKLTAEVIIAGLEPPTSVSARSAWTVNLQLDGAVTFATY